MNEYQREYERGSNDATRRVRDNLICTLIGFQNDIGHHKADDPAYVAYQKVMDMIENEYGPLMKPVKK